VRALFVLVKRTVAHLQHIEIVETSRRCVLRHVGSVGSDVGERVPAVRNVSGHAPRVTVVLAPGPDTVATPLAHGEENGSTSASESVAHRGVVRLCARAPIPACLRSTASNARKVAGIVLPVVDAPRCQSLRILCLMALGAWISGTRHGARVAVQTELETLVVDFVDDRLHALRPLLWVWNEEARAVTLFGVPTVIDVEVLVASVLES
jgi:hypothetical protein